MLDLRLPEPVLRAWMALLRAGISLPEAARQESLAALRHAFAEDCGCEREPLDSTACGAGEHKWCAGCGCECHRKRDRR